MGMSNTSNDGTQGIKGYLSPLGSSYYDYNILQLIRNRSGQTYTCTDDFSSADMYRAGNSFDISKVSGQFKESGKLNSKKNIGYTFTVNSISSTRASITVTKL